MTHQGVARDAASVHFLPRIRRTDILLVQEGSYLGTLLPLKSSHKLLTGILTNSHLEATFGGQRWGQPLSQILNTTMSVWGGVRWKWAERQPPDRKAATQIVRMWIIQWVTIIFLSKFCHQIYWNVTNPIFKNLQIKDAIHLTFIQINARGQLSPHRFSFHQFTPLYCYYGLSHRLRIRDLWC